MKTIKIKHYTEMPDNFTGIVEYASGTKCWYKDGKWHRLDGPAMEYAHGTKYWYIEDKEYSYEEWLEETEFYRTLVGVLFK